MNVHGSKQTLRSRVLILTPGFPPSAESGVHRTLKFVKYLGPFGWYSIVVTLSVEAYPFLDQHLEAEIPKEVVVYRTRFPALARSIRDWVDTSTPRPSALSSRRRSPSWKRFLRKMNILLVPDIYIAWLPYAITACMMAVQRHRPCALLVSAPPPSVTVIGAIVSRLLSLPLVIDFRDGWTVEPYYYSARRKRSSLRYWTEACLESLVFKCADHVICQQAVMARDYIAKYPQWHSKISILNNGFDEADFAGVKPYDFERPTLLHTGYLEERRDPEAFFQALTILRTKRPDLMQGLQVLLVGRTEAEFPRMVDDLNLKDLVQFQDHVNHRTAVSMMLGSWGLLLLTGGDESELPGKLFEYIGSRRPIFAVAHPRGQSAEIIEAAEAGMVVPGANPETIAAGLETFLSRLASGDCTRNDVELYRFTRRYATEQLAKVLDQVSA